MYDIILTAVTCEHGIRGETSLRDLAFVRELCEKRNIPLFEFRADVPALAKASGRGIEEEARLFRYRCFEEIVERGDADAVATAHHSDDLAETVLFRLARGTSVSGINAIRERSGIVRPFLGVSRAEILAYVAERSLPYVEDETNADERYRRNYIRHTVLPALESVVHGAGKHIAAFALRAGEDDELLCRFARERIRKDGETFRIPVDLPRPLFLRAVVIAASELATFRDYTESTLKEAEKLLFLQSGRKISLGCGAEAVREGGEIVLYLPREPFAGEISFAEGEFAVGPYRVTVGSEGPLRADFDAFPQDCVLRVRREGDVFVPYGGGKKSLKAFLTDRKIPARKGRELPLVAKGNEIFVVCGVEISDRVKVTKDTVREIHLDLK